MSPDWKLKINTGHTQPEQSTMKIRYRSLSGTWIVAEVNTLTCKDFYATIHFRTLMPIYENRKYLQWQLKDPNKLSEKQWNTLLLNLYKKTKQKDSFDIRHRFLYTLRSRRLLNSKK